MSSALPALPPPPGHEPFSPHPESLARWNLICVTVCLSVTTVLFLLRSFVRLHIKRSWILEDYVVLVSWIGLGILCALMSTVIHNHGGKHEWDLVSADVPRAIYWFNAATIVYSPVILGTKIAIILLYRRVFLPHRGGPFDWLLRIFIFILTCFYVATMLVKVWECTPREKAWNKAVPGRCVNVSSLLNASGLFNCITDVMMLLIPVKSVWLLRMSMRQKAGVVAIFTVGFCAPVFSTIGFVVRIRISSSPDVTYHYPEILLWAAAEITTGLMCVCTPELAALGRLRRRSRRPSASILHGATTIRRSNPYKSKRRGGSDEQALWNEVHPKEQRSFTDMGKFEDVPIAVITSIEGGVKPPGRVSRDDRCPTQADIDNATLNLAAPSRKIRKDGIFKSVRIEQTSS